MRLISSSVGHIVTAQEEFKDIDLLNPISIELRLKRGWQDRDLQREINQAVMHHGHKVRTIMEENVCKIVPFAQNCMARFI